MTIPNNKQNKILIVSAPSGAGKTSLTRALVSKFDDVGLTVSHTTRDLRPGEVDGVHYHFIEKSEFEEMIENEQFIEYATVFENYYGTSVAEIQRLLDNGQHAILDIDWQGARKVREKFPLAVSAFIIPPSMDVLEQRLRERKRDSDEVIARRMKEAESELSHQSEYEYIIVNDDFEAALEQLEHILYQDIQTPN